VAGMAKTPTMTPAIATTLNTDAISRRLMTFSDFAAVRSSSLRPHHNRSIR
jgi:hypothetical protein